jgi:hypothetical protein
MGQQDSDEHARREMAESLDCFTEQQVQTLGLYAPTTLENLRKRGQGPEYIVFGKAFLYPRQSFRDFLHARVRERKATAGRVKDLL